MPEPRDPRVDPMPGDRLRDEHQYRTVTGRGYRHPHSIEMPRSIKEFVRFKFSMSMGSAYSFSGISGWRKWAKNAEVLHIA